MEKAISISTARLLSQWRKLQPRRAAVPLAIEQLLDRTLPSSFSVLNLNDSGMGSLRQAIVDANAHLGPDLISFGVAGTIQLSAGALPAITEKVDINGTTAPGFAGTPVVAVNFNQLGGLVFNPGSVGSALRSLSLGNANGVGVEINGGGSMIVVGNYIGVALDGTTVAGNGGNGLGLNGSTGNTIGGTVAQDRNIISGNGNNGIDLNGSFRNQIVGNFIGTDAAGTLDVGNAGNGIQVRAGAAGNAIGGLQGNVISGNAGNGILLNGGATRTSVSGNTIGLTSSGTAALGNTLDGVKLKNSDHNLIGQSDPVSGVTYNNSTSVPTQPVSGWQGIRESDTSGQYLISGTSQTSGLIFDGTIEGVGTSFVVNYPNAANTSVYGPDNLGGGVLRLVGSYRTTETTAVTVNGFLFEGTTADLSNPANYRTLDYPGAVYNYAHSTMGGLSVGNYDSPVDHGTASLPLGPGHAYLYDVAAGAFLTDVVFPGSKSNTAYGIWYNGGTSYTICGGYSLDAVNNFDNQDRALGHGYLVDYDSATGIFSNWASYDDPNGTNLVTHFEGISSVEKGVYTLNADTAQTGSTNPGQGSWVAVRRNSDGSFGKSEWVALNYPGVDPTANITSSNSVSGNQVIGIVVGPQGGIPFQATVNIGFQLSNVIGGNGGDGISLYGANNNQISTNHIGTDVTGTLVLGNARNGIMMTAGASGNLIGGAVSNGNDPTGGVFVRPPLGNLISGNNGNGVFIRGEATQNTLSGNFIGTAASGNSALGNSRDGVALLNANGNSLLGCTIQDNPFVYYNVISGNGANGLRVTSSNNTTIQANFFGMGANNNTAVGNALNGVVVEGTSADTVMGGPIPLGNVDAANGLNGIVVRDSASGFTSYNTFCGLAAFSDSLSFGNGLNGMLITTTGANILIRTNVVTCNGNNGIEISGAAHGVRVVGNIIGLNTDGLVAMGNLNNGVEVSGNASNIVIGGPQPTFNIVPYNFISANGGNGVAITGLAHDININSSHIGTDIAAVKALGNAHAGVYLGAGTHATTVGSTKADFRTIISGNLSNGIEMQSTSNNTVIGTVIGTDSTGLLALPNGANGVLLSNSSNNLIGRLPGSTSGTPANTIAFNAANGVLIDSGTGNGILGNAIFSNILLGIDLGPGANQNLAAPVLTSVTTSPQGVLVAGSLTATPNSAFTVEFFASDTNTASGRYYLGSQIVSTNGVGSVMFSFTGPLPPQGNSFITATATDAQLNSSEFSLPLM